MQTEEALNTKKRIFLFNNSISGFRFIYSTLIVISLIYTGFIYWSCLLSFLASLYWHLFDPNVLGFNLIALFGALVGFFILPLILLIPSISIQLQTSTKFRLIEITFNSLLLGSALQIQQTTRTFLFAVLLPILTNRIFFLPPAANSCVFSSLFPLHHPSSVALLGGLFLLLCMRSLCWSLLPFDLVDLWYIPAILIFLYLASSIILIFYDLFPMEKEFPDFYYDSYLQIAGSFEISDKRNRENFPRKQQHQQKESFIEQNEQQSSQFRPEQPRQQQTEQHQRKLTDYSYKFNEIQHLFSYCQSQSNSDTLAASLLVPDNMMLKYLYVICSAVLLASVMFLILLLLTENSVIPRWASHSLDSVFFGYLVNFVLGFSWFFQSFILPHLIRQILIYMKTKTNQRILILMVIRQIFLFLFVAGGTILIFAQETSDPLMLVGGCFFIFSVPVVADVAVNLFCKMFLNLNFWFKLLLSMVFNLWLLGGFCTVLAWYACGKFPLVGNLFCNNMTAIFMTSFVSCSSSFIIIEIISFIELCRATKETEKDQNSVEEIETERRNMENAEVKETLTDAESQIEKTQLTIKTESSIDDVATTNDEYDYKNSLSSSIVFLLVYGLMISCLYLPSLRCRMYHHSLRGSKITALNEFRIITFNIQQGYSYPGFPVAQRMTDIDSKLSPNVWALQESDSTNLLNINRDWVSYLSDHLLLYPFYGAPSRVSTPGVAFLSNKRLGHPQYELLPKSDGPVGRIISFGVYNWTNSGLSDETLEIIVAVVHLSAFSENAVEAQLKRISEMIKSKFFLNRPLILVGDFNVDPEKTDIIWESKQFNQVLTEGKLRLANNNSVTNLSSIGDPRIDHIYYRYLCLYEFSVLNAVGLSDHLPVYASFKKPAVEFSEICPNTLSNTNDSKNNEKSKV